jgi:hypothetical protein
MTKREKAPHRRSAEFSIRDLYAAVGNTPGGEFEQYSYDTSLGLFRQPQLIGSDLWQAFSYDSRP